MCRPAVLGATLTLTELARTLARPLAVQLDEEQSVAVLGEPGGTTIQRGDLAPDLVLADADGQSVDVTRRGRRTLVVAWSTWCGCRYELPAWKQLTDELQPLGLDLVAVALDDDPDRVRHWTGRADLPPVLDPEHRLSDVFGVVNVPSTVWLEEDGRVAKPPTIAPGDDQFKEFTEVDAERHHEALRRWVREGVVPEEQPGEQHGVPTDGAGRRGRPAAGPRRAPARRLAAPQRPGGGGGTALRGRRRTRAARLQHPASLHAPAWAGPVRRGVLRAVGAVERCRTAGLRADLSHGSGVLAAGHRSPVRFRTWT